MIFITKLFFVLISPHFTKSTWINDIENYEKIISESADKINGYSKNNQHSAIFQDCNTTSNFTYWKESSMTTEDYDYISIVEQVIPLWNTHNYNGKTISHHVGYNDMLISYTNSSITNINPNGFDVCATDETYSLFSESWFTAPSSGTKNLILLLEISSIMSSTEFANMKTLANAFVDSLSHVDFLNVITFDYVDYVFNDNILFRANPTNKKYFKEYINDLQQSDTQYANPELAFRSAKDLFGKTERSYCLNSIVLLTSGTINVFANKPTDSINKSTVVVSISMSNIDDNTKIILQKIYCEYNGYFVQFTDTTSVINQYYNYIANSKTNQQIVWTIDDNYNYGNSLLVTGSTSIFSKGFTSERTFESVVAISFILNGISKSDFNIYIMSQIQCDNFYDNEKLASQNSDFICPEDEISIDYLYENDVPDADFIAKFWIYETFVPIGGLILIWSPYVIAGVMKKSWCVCDLFAHSIGTGFLLIFLFSFFLYSYKPIFKYENYHEIEINVAYKRFTEYDCTDLTCTNDNITSSGYCIENIIGADTGYCNNLFTCKSYSDTNDCDCSSQFNPNNNQYEYYCSNCRVCNEYIENRGCYSTSGKCFGSFVLTQFDIDGKTYSNYHVDRCERDDFDCANTYLNEYLEGDTFIGYYYPNDNQIKDEIKSFKHDYSSGCQWWSNEVKCENDYRASIIIPLVGYFGAWIAAFVLMILRLANCDF